ncbi:MAG: hypothetical protein IT366_15615 [Candidatus Hydrogenedentes bacterium]|nr:hypothetical protein [Candidatus Hydrogenedentota bacterium]
MPDTDTPNSNEAIPAPKRKRKVAKKKIKRKIAAARATKSAPRATAEPTSSRAAKLATNLIAFEKATFANATHLLGAINDQSERAIKNALGDASWMPKEGQEFVKEWNRTLRSTLKDFAKSVDKSFDLLSHYVERVQSETSKKK